MSTTIKILLALLGLAVIGTVLYMRKQKKPARTPQQIYDNFSYNMTQNERIYHTTQAEIRGISFLEYVLAIEAGTITNVRYIPEYITNITQANGTQVSFNGAWANVGQYASDFPTPDPTQGKPYIEEYVYQPISGWNYDHSAGTTLEAFFLTR